MTTDQVGARRALMIIGATEDQDFHTLDSGQAETVLQFADAARYRSPKNANGSRARYYFARLQRRARGKPVPPLTPAPR